MESYLYINIHTGKWLKIGRGTEPIPQWMKLLVSGLVPAELSPFRCEVALWDGWEEHGIQRVWFFLESYEFFDNSWVFTSERYGDRFRVWMTFGNNRPREIDGRRTTFGFAMRPLDTWRTVEVGEILMAHPPDYHTEE